MKPKNDWLRSLQLAWTVLYPLHNFSRMKTIMAILRELKETGGFPKIVKVVDLIDNQANRLYLGMLGWLRGPILPHDHGASDQDPFLLVDFQCGDGDGFWREELGGPEDAVKLDEQDWFLESEDGEEVFL